jgi:hypothetical protein
MNEQLSMLPVLDAALIAVDTTANVRSRDPETSRVAARRANEFAATQCDTIHAALKRHGPMSKDRIASRVRLDSVAVARRLSDLQKAGRAAPTGDLATSVSGRPERVWRAI